jgi:membrane protease YdiL (CAAX protease family)
VLWEGLQRAFPLWFVVALTTLEFTLLHAGQYGWGGLLGVAAAGLALAWVRWRSGLVTLAVLTHMLINSVSVAFVLV